MALRPEQRRASLIGAGDLPVARLDNATPDLSGLQSLAGAFMRAGDKKRREKDEKQSIRDQLDGMAKGAEAGRAWVGKDENGNSIEVQIPDATPAFMRGWVSGFDQSQDARFRTAVETRFNEVQSRFIAGEIGPQDATQLMQDYLEGALGAAPAHRRGAWGELGQAEVMQRSTLMTTQDATKRAQLVADDLALVIKDGVARASSHASAGGDPAPMLREVDAAYDRLFDMRRIGEAEVKFGKQAVRQLVTGQALVNTLTTAMAKGEITPDDVDRFGTAIETNDATAEAAILKGYAVSPIGEKAFVQQGYKSADVFKKITDESLRKEMGLKLRQAATDWRARVAANVEARALGDELLRLRGADGRFSALDPSLRDEADDMMGRILTEMDPFTDPGAQKNVVDLLAITKYVPKQLITAIQAKAGSGNPQHVGEAVALYRALSFLRNEQGDDVGAMLRASMPDEFVGLMDALDAGFRANIDAVDLMNNIKTARGKDEFTIGSSIGAYNLAVEADGGFDKAFRDRWSGDYDMVPDPEVKGRFKDAYRHAYIVLRDPVKAFDQAYALTRERFRRSDIIETGYEEGDGTLANPEGYEGAEGEWINGYVRDQLLEGVTAGTLALPEGIETREEFEALVGVLPAAEKPSPTSRAGLALSPETRASRVQEWLGRTAKLVPVPGSNPDYPEYMVRLISPEGEDLGPAMQQVGNGVRPLIVNPHGARQNLSVKYAQTRRLEAVTKAADESLMRLEDRVLNMLTPEQQGQVTQDLPLSEFLPKVAPDLAKQYNLDRSIIEKALDEERKAYERATGEVLPPSKIGPQSLMQPRAAGLPVAAVAAKTIDAVLPDGTGGDFLMRIAAQESNFGKAEGTFRLSGDKGMTQVNTRSGFREVKRRLAMGKGRVFNAAVKLRDELGLDLFNLQPADLDRPVVAMAVARLYIEAVGQPVPQDVAGQGRWWKQHYNTYLGTGTAEQFVASAAKVPPTWRDDYRIEPTAGEP
jgi:hypothetical protein